VAHAIIRRKKIFHATDTSFMTGKRRPAYTDYRNQPLFSGLFLSVLFHLFLLTIQFGVSALRSSDTNGVQSQPLPLTVQLTPAPAESIVATPDAGTSAPVQTQQLQTNSQTSPDLVSPAHTGAFQLVDPQPVQPEVVTSKTGNPSRKSQNKAMLETGNCAAEKD